MYLNFSTTTSSSKSIVMYIFILIKFYKNKDIGTLFQFLNLVLLTRVDGLYYRITKSI